MKVAIIGYGKMGKTIVEILVERGHEIVLKIGSQNLNDFTLQNLQKADVAIEFSNPDAAVENYYTCFEAGIPVVSGTTAWLDKLDEVKAKLKEKNATLFYAPNFSIGVNLFFKVNEVLAKLMNQHPNYKVEMEEIHHVQKLDSPSGTAIKTAEGILKNLDRKTAWKEAEEVSENEIQIHAKREKGVAGTHAVHYFSEEDSIELKHTAHSRKGFALGSVLAAEWVLDKQGFFGMEDLLAL